MNRTLADYNCGFSLFLTLFASFSGENEISRIYIDSSGDTERRFLA
jgi:hypothetical protein